jgi:hypothetical protein
MLCIYLAEDRLADLLHLVERGLIDRNLVPSEHYLGRKCTNVVLTKPSRRGRIMPLI